MKGVLTPSAYLRVWGVWVAVALGAFLLCMFVGPGDPGTHGISFGWPSAGLRDLRMLRVIPAGLVGLALAGAGVTLQALLRNPLADPYVLGISSGSSVGVMVWLLATGPLYAMFAGSRVMITLFQQGVMVPALLGAIVTCVVVFALARPRRGAGGVDSLTLLLVGVVVSAINAALLMLVNSLAPAGVKADLMNYMMGSISNDVTWGTVSVAVAVLAVGYVPVLLAGRALNVGSLSDVEAASLGVNVGRLRTICFVSASVTTGAAIMLSGPIGFVGLICPHICRSMVGADHRKLAVAAPLCGAAFLMLADTFVSATGAVFHGELPVGVITAICGGPFFLVLLKRRNLRGGGE